MVKSEPVRLSMPNPYAQILTPCMPESGSVRGGGGGGGPIVARN